MFVLMSRSNLHYADWNSILGPKVNRPVTVLNAYRMSLHHYLLLSNDRHFRRNSMIRHCLSCCYLSRRRAPVCEISHVCSGTRPETKQKSKQKSSESCCLLLFFLALIGRSVL